MKYLIIFAIIALLDPFLYCKELVHRISSPNAASIRVAAVMPWSEKFSPCILSKPYNHGTMCTAPTIPMQIMQRKIRGADFNVSG